MEKRVVSEVDENLKALISNVSAVKAISSAVEGTLGPKGLDTMLVDSSGEIVITNDGVTILDMMEVSHPASRMLINIARAQHREVGDGTTTATIIASTLVSEGLNHVMKGVPVTRVIEGIRRGVLQAIEDLKSMAVKVNFPEDPLLYSVALISGRGDESIAHCVVESAKVLGLSRLMDKSFLLRDIVVGVERGEDEVFHGLVIKKKPLNEAMPRAIDEPKILCVDDALEMEKPEEASLRTESGFRMYLEKQREFINNLKRAISLGVNVVFVHRGVSDKAEEILTDAGVLCVSRLTSSQMRRICEHTGAVAIKKTALPRILDDIERYVGKALRVYRDEDLKNIRIEKGSGIPTATLLVSASTREVVEERERIAKDSASSLQAAFPLGVVSGGGSAELSVSRKLRKFRSSLTGMAGFGVDCVIEALKKPMSQIIQNAGFNPLEKVEEVLAEQERKGKDTLGIDCETGKVVDMFSLGVVDPVKVKIFALKSALDVAQAILRIRTVIKMRDFKGSLLSDDRNFM